MRRLLQIASVMIIVLNIVSCATVNVGSHVDRSVDFSRYRTFDWGPADALPIGDRRLESNPFFRDHLQGAVEKGLVGRGFQLTKGESPDLLVHYHANISERLLPDYQDGTYGYCADLDCSPTVLTNSSEVGTLVIDVVDARRGKLLWRGWVQRRVEDFLDDGDRMAKTIDESIREVLLRLPATL
jgi:hypothetical protein